MDSVILLDVPAAGGEFVQTILEKFEHPVDICHGPCDGGCPLLEGRGCHKFDEAHGIVFALDLDVPEHRAILQRYRELADPDVPIRAVVRPDQLERYRDLLAEIEIWTHDPNVSEIDGFAAEVEAGDRVRGV